MKNRVLLIFGGCYVKEKEENLEDGVSDRRRTFVPNGYQGVSQTNDYERDGSLV